MEKDNHGFFLTFFFSNRRRGPVSRMNPGEKFLELNPHTHVPHVTNEPVHFLFVLGLCKLMSVVVPWCMASVLLYVYIYPVCLLFLLQSYSFLHAPTFQAL